MKKFNGMTLVELLITVTIVAIIAIAALTVYTSQVRRGRRIDGINSILGISLAEERYRSSNTQYGTLAQVWNSVATSADGYYALAISNVGAATYTITATAQGNQASDAESGTSCTALVLTVSNGTVTKSPAVCWPS